MNYCITTTLYLRYVIIIGVKKKNSSGFSGMEMKDSTFMRSALCSSLYPIEKIHPRIIMPLLGSIEKRVGPHHAENRVHLIV